MPTKKQSALPPENEDPELAQRVDAMMDLHYLDNDKEAPAIAGAVVPELPLADSTAPIDIFKELHTEPAVVPAVLEPPLVEPDASEKPSVPDVGGSENPIQPLPENVSKLNDAATEQAVDDIILSESDALLVAQDELNAREHKS